MERTLGLADQGRGAVSPNPLVGATIVGVGAGGVRETLGEGFHAEFGGPHAEPAALADCVARGHDPRGATMYVSLEPCAHHGQQPPCVEAIVEAGISRVVIASEDPTPKASGNGPRILAEAGIAVVWADPGDGDRRGSGTGADLARRARLQNQAFRKHARCGRPLVIFKAAASLDGRVATRGGESKWISSVESRALGHRWRVELDAIAIGSGTARADNPLLTARPDGEEPPVGRPHRIVFDSKASLDLNSRLVASLEAAPVLVVVGPGADRARVEALRGAGVEVLEVATGPGGVAIDAALEELGRRDITSLLLEGGPRLAGAFADAGLIDEVRLFTSPMLLGAGIPALEGAGRDRLDQISRGHIERVEAIGGDALVMARIREW